MKNTIRFSFIFEGIILLLFLFWSACKKEKDEPQNPFAELNETSNGVTDTLDANTFVGIHRNILAVKCANPSCHDGSFEPDYRTVESAYNTLVYHPVVKKVGNWSYRVLPFDTAKSWLWQRVTHDKIISGADTSGGRMPLYKDALSSVELKNISTWIMNGARDIHGIVPKYPNQEPRVNAYIAVDSANYSILSSGYQRVDSLYYNPFIVSKNQAMLIAVDVKDDSTTVPLMQNPILKFSLSKDNFMGATAYPCTYLSFTDSTGFHELWMSYVNTKNFPSDTTVYMRFYVNDGDHATATEFPLTESLFYYKSFWAFYIKP